MARASHEVKVRLTAEDRASKSLDSARKSIEGTKQSLESFDKATKVAGKSTDEFSSRLKTGMVAAAAAAAGAIYGLAKAFKAGFSSMIEAEKANRALQIALKKTDDATKENISALKAQANAIQSTTRYTADSITQTQAFLKQLGVQTSQLGQATQATVDLSESLGLTLESAARNVGKTVGGFAGELGELIPELKQLDAEALKSGEGIALLAEKFKGAAKAAGQEGLEGALEQLNNELTDAKKSFAIGVTGATDFEGAVRGATAGLRDSQSAIEDTGRFWGVVLGKPLGIAKGALEDIGTIIAGKTNPALVQVTKRTQEAADKHRQYADTLAYIEAQEKTRIERLKALDQGYQSLGDKLDRLKALSERDARVNEEAADRIEKVTETMAELGIATEETTEGAIQKHLDALEQMRIAYDQRLSDATGKRLVDLKALNEAEEKTAAIVAKLRGEVDDETESLNRSSEAFRQATGAVDGYTGSVNQNTAALRANTQEQQANTNAKGRRSFWSGGAYGPTESYLPTESYAPTGKPSIQRTRPSGYIALVGGVRYRVMADGTKVPV